MQVSKKSISFLVNNGGTGFDAKKFEKDYYIREASASHVEIMKRSDSIKLADLKDTADDQVTIPVRLGTELVEAGIITADFVKNVDMGEAFKPQGQNQELVKLVKKVPGRNPLAIFEKKVVEKKETSETTAVAATTTHYGDDDM